jgi:hypothetical protein
VTATILKAPASLLRQGRAAVLRGRDGEIKASTGANVTLA